MMYEKQISEIDKKKHAILDEKYNFKTFNTAHVAKSPMGFELMICGSKVVQTDRMSLCKLRPNTKQVRPSLYETLTTLNYDDTQYEKSKQTI